MAELTNLVNARQIESDETMVNIHRWADGALPFINSAVYEMFILQAPLELVHDCFWRQLPFGTGGVRGTVGLGPNRINFTVAALTIQGHCDYIRQNEEEAGGVVVVANDVRRFADRKGVLAFMGDEVCREVTSRSLARLAAAIYAANGFSVRMISPSSDDGLLTTPELSYLIRHYEAAGGVNMSASHNHPDDNGLKIYDRKGGQYLPPQDDLIAKMALDATAVDVGNFERSVAAGAITDVDLDAIEGYFASYEAMFSEITGLSSIQGSAVGFTPLAGCGERTVVGGLQRAGFEVLVPPEHKADGSFSYIPLLAPNPEVPESTEKLYKPSQDGSHKRPWIEDQHVTLLLAADPDADRLGVDVLTDTGWKHLTGNEIATVLAFFLLLDADGPKRRGPVYSTIVTSLAVPEIASRAGVSHVRSDLLVGFKYIGHAIEEYSSSLTEPDKVPLLSFAAEESHGYLASEKMRDKDALSGAVYLAFIHERERRRGGSLYSYLGKIYEVIGAFGDKGRSILTEGSEGFEQIHAVMAGVRAQPWSTVAGREVLQIIDYADESSWLGPFTSRSDRDARNVVVVQFAEGQVTLRPSGTEPKLKFYVQLRRGEGIQGELQKEAEEIADTLYLDLCNSLGIPLTGPGAYLPDVVSLPRKRLFETVVAAALKDVLNSRRSASRKREDIGRVMSRVVDGADPLSGAERALRLLPQGDELARLAFGEDKAAN